MSIWWRLRCSVVMTRAMRSIFFRSSRLPRQVEAGARLAGLELWQAGAARARDLLAVEEPKPEPAKIRALRYEAAPVAQTHAIIWRIAVRRTASP
jgi:hypothetical protein